jgi:hypothetical protein
MEVIIEAEVVMMEIETDMGIGSQGAMKLFEETDQGEVFDSTHRGISRQMFCI